MPIRFALTLICLLALPVSADELEEREYLEKVQAELAAIRLHLKSAEASADPDARVRFRYDWLRRDLAKIQRGVQAHIDAASIERDNRTPVRGDYRR